MSEQHQFQAEVSRLLDIVAHALYSERQIFLRELISNASDACDRLRYEAIAKPDLLSGDADFKVKVDFDATARTVTIADNGIGMTRDELIKNLGTIAHSGTRAALGDMGEAAKKDSNLIGQFGVGFYSAFMVAHKVEVASRKAGAEKAYHWVSDGRGSFTIDETLKSDRGTTITLHIKDEASEFLLEERLKQVIKTYSDHIAFPILLTGVAVNSASALWTRPKNDITADQYKEFYRSVSGGMSIDEPWATIHWRAEGAVEYTNLLFIPSMKPFDLYDPRRHHGVKLYVRRVFITEGVEGLIPPFLRFVKGVIDSADLPLNISREVLQSNPLVAKMGTAVTKKILSELEDRAIKDPAGFENFWALFGAVVKEGLYDAHAHREQLCRVARFYSSGADGLTSLDEYISRMKEGQDEIYYLSAPTLDAARNSPQLEAFKAKGIEVLFMTDTIDEFWLPMQNDYKQKKFKSITRGAVDLSKVKTPDTAASATPEDNKAAAPLIEKLKQILSGEVKDVTLSSRLVDSAVCLVAPDHGVDIHMQRMLKKSQGYDAQQQHVLEINAAHPVIRKLETLAANDQNADQLRETAFLLLDQARILEGEPLKNPADFARRMTRAIELGLAG
jgi:molecular chaperone HtpG